MIRDNIFTRALIGALVVVLAAPLGVLAANNSTSQVYSRAKLDQMLAPVALYPDSLLAQVLIAATYPDQVAEADRRTQPLQFILIERLWFTEQNSMQTCRRPFPAVETARGPQNETEPNRSVFLPHKTCLVAT